MPWLGPRDHEHSTQLPTQLPAPACLATHTLERGWAPLPAGSGGYQMAHVPIPGSNRFYTVEVRSNSGNVGAYEGRLCSNSTYGWTGPVVVIHEVDPARSAPAYVIGPDNNGQTCDGGAMWTRGETFADRQAKISIASGSPVRPGVDRRPRAGLP